jgi:hypothetical protein
MVKNICLTKNILSHNWLSDQMRQVRLLVYADIQRYLGVDKIFDFSNGSALQAVFEKLQIPNIFQGFQNS